MGVGVSTALHALLEAGHQGVVVAEGSPKVLLWTLEDLFCEEEKLKALKEIFPKLEVRGPIILLGRFDSVAKAYCAFAETKRSPSVTVRSLSWSYKPERLTDIKNWHPGRKE
jgi:hypothetical protein